MTQSITPSTAAVEVPAQRIMSPGQLSGTTPDAVARSTPGSHPTPAAEQRPGLTAPADAPTQVVVPVAPARPAGSGSAGTAPSRAPEAEAPAEASAGLPPAEPAATTEPGVAEPVADLADPSGRPHLTEWQELVPSSEPLPDLVSPLAAVPGGLGADLVGDFTFAGRRWTAEDARWDASPIGAQLAMEQRGLSAAADGPADAEQAGARHRQSSV